MAARPILDRQTRLKTAFRGCQNRRPDEARSKDTDWSKIWTFCRRLALLVVQCLNT